MKYAIIADVHANLEALTAVLASIAREDADRIVCLGDIVGYNASPNTCVQLVRARARYTISGNHDRAAVGSKSTESFGRAARRAVEWTQAALTEENLEYLAELPPHLLVDSRFFVVHGALHPEPNDELHLSNDARIARSFEELATGRFGSNVCFFGHSHRSAIYEHRAGKFRRIDASSATLDSDAHYLVNPGSVGQSRDGDSRAAYALFDAEKSTLELRRVPYDSVRAAQKTRAARLVMAESWSARSAHWIEGQIDRGRDLVLHRARAAPRLYRAALTLRRRRQG